MSRSLSEAMSIGDMAELYLQEHDEHLHTLAQLRTAELKLTAALLDVAALQAVLSKSKIEVRKPVRNVHNANFVKLGAWP